MHAYCARKYLTIITFAVKNDARKAVKTFCHSLHRWHLFSGSKSSSQIFSLPKFFQISTTP